MLTAVTLPDMPRKPAVENEKKLPVAARLAPSVLEAMQILADADERTLSFMIERAVREYVERHAKPLPAKPKR
jgi:hypothetical protein